MSAAREKVHCGKIRFPNLVQARHRALLDTKRFKTKHYVYRCPKCGAWHMSTSPGPDCVDVKPNWKPTIDKGPGHDRGWQPTWMLHVLRWYHAEMALLRAPGSHEEKRARIERNLRRRGVM